MVYVIANETDATEEITGTRPKERPPKIMQEPVEPKEKNKGVVPETCTSPQRVTENITKDITKRNE